jgi:uncharacterized repeat protein (TIGR01451 family)
MKNIFPLVRSSGFLFLVFCLFTTSNPLHAQWVQTNLTFGARTFAQYDNGGVTYLFAGDQAGGGVYRSTDGGLTWVQKNNGLTNTNAYALAVSGTNLFAGTFFGLNGGVYRSTDNGDNWTAINGLPPNTNIYSLFYSGTFLFAGTNQGVYRYNGTGWTQANTGLPSGMNVHAFAVSGGYLIAGGYGSGCGACSGIFRSTDDGSNWLAAPMTGLTNREVEALAVVPDGAGGTRLYAGPINGNGVFRSTDGGDHWNNVSSGLPINTSVNCFAAFGAHLFAGSNAGVFLLTTTSLSWTAVNEGLGTNPYVHSLALSGANLFAGGVVFPSKTWKRPLSEMIPPMTYVSSEVSQPNTDDVERGSVNQEIIGVRVTTTGLEPPLTVTSLTFNTTGTTSTSNILRARVFYTGSSATFSSSTIQFGNTVTSPSGTFLVSGSQVLTEGDNYFWLAYDIALNAPDLNLVDGGCTQIMIGGTPQTPSPTNPSGTRRIVTAAWVLTNYNNMSRYPKALAAYGTGSGNTNLFAGVSLDGVYYSPNNGTSWIQVINGMQGGTDVNALAVIPNGPGGANLFSGITGGGVFRTRNDGANWTLQTNGLPTGYDEISAFAVGPGGPNGTYLYMGSRYGGVFRSGDFGDLWTNVNGNLTNTNVVALTVNGQDVFAATASGVFHSSNNGATWTQRGLNYVQALTVVPITGGGTMLVAGTRYDGVLVSTNNGTSWTQRLSNYEIISFAVSGTNVFAGTSGGVYYSTNSGISWGSANTGSLRYHSVSCLTATDEFLYAGLRSTGEVWKRPLSALITQGTGSIFGRVYHDLGTCAPGQGLAGWTVRLDPPTGGPRFTTTDANGNYSFGFLNAGMYVVSEIVKTNWQQSCPSSPYTYTITLMQGQTVTDKDFGNISTPNVQDLSVSLAAGLARPGFTVSYGVVYGNIGTVDVTNVTVVFTLPSQVGTPILSNPPGIYNSGTGTVTWNLPTVPSGSSAWLNVSGRIPSTVPLGTTLNSSVEIQPLTGDANPADNTATESQVVRGSFDPNDKAVKPEGTIAADTTLEYLIRFQNVGTDTAFNIVVRDDLDANLDLTTLEPGASSHPYTLAIESPRELVWTFENILLPDSNVNEPGSHGFVKFKIRPRSDILGGTAIWNSASVFFDFNAPVVTNIVMNMVLPANDIGALTLRGGTPEQGNSAGSNSHLSEPMKFERGRGKAEFARMYGDRSISPEPSHPAVYISRAPIDFKADVTNFGSAVQSSYQVGWKIDASPQTNVSNTQPLAPGATDSLSLTWMSPTEGLHTARVWSLLASDMNPANDSSASIVFEVVNIVFQEGFNSTGLPNGWHIKNLDGGGTTTWRQGNSYFSAYEGSGYIAADYHVANGLYIDEWLVSPNTGSLTVDSLSFWTRSPKSPWSDSIMILVSTTDTAATSFTTVLDYFEVSRSGWERRAYALPSAETRYIAFRYLIYSGGSSGDNSNYLGLDDIRIIGHSSNTTTTVGVPVAQNWNIVSQPVSAPMPDDSVSHLYTNSTTPFAYAFDNAYVLRYTMTNGPGYWIKSSTDYTQNIVGTARDTLSIPVNSGWNMIGSISTAIDTSTAHVTPSVAGLRASIFYKFSSSGGYVVASTIDPGRGYWVKASANGSFFMHSATAPGVPVGKTQASGRSIEELNTLTIRDASGAEQTLYFGADASGEIPSYDLPPLPPVGAFDARFTSSEGGTLVQTHAEEVNTLIEKQIAIQSSAYPLTVSWKIRDGSYELRIGNGIVEGLQEKGTLKINDDEVNRLTLRVRGSGNELPKEFALYQNYPNPFNPTTTIKYALPVDSRVTVVVYNILGQNVKTLLDEERKAGYHTLQWNGTNDAGAQLASGMYFLRLSAEGNNGKKFTEVKKLLLLK